MFSRGFSQKTFIYGKGATPKISGQIIIFHQPRFPWDKGISSTKPPFGVRSCEVAIIWPEDIPDYPLFSPNLMATTMEETKNLWTCHLLDSQLQISLIFSVPRLRCSVQKHSWSDHVGSKAPWRWPRERRSQRTLIIMLESRYDIFKQHQAFVEKRTCRLFLEYLYVCILMIIYYFILYAVVLK